MAVDFSVYDITYEADTGYGVVGGGVGGGDGRVRAGAGGNPFATLNTLNSGSADPLTCKSIGTYEIPIRISAAADVVATPLPAPIALFGVGMAGLGLAARRRKG